MKRTVIVVVSSAFAVVTLAFGGVAFAQSQDPLGLILAALGLIKAQTAGIEDQVKVLGTKIDKLGANQRPAPSAQRLWVSPFWSDLVIGSGLIGGGGRDAHLFNPSIYVLNPGDIDAEISCVFLAPNGSLLSDRGNTYIARGGTRSLCSSGAGRFEFGAGWMVLSSDRPILPYGYYQTGMSLGGREPVNMKFYPVDCTDPSDDSALYACRIAAKPAL